MVEPALLGDIGSDVGRISQRMARADDGGETGEELWVDGGGQS
jgi:hypothetical protein